MDPIAIQNRQLTVRIAEPDATQAIGKFKQYSCLWEVVAATIRCPNAIGQPVQTVAAEGDPYSSLLILGNRLQEVRLVHHFRGKVHANEIVSDKMPKTTFPGEPERLVRCAVGESRCHLRETTLGFAARDMIKVRFYATTAETDPYRPIVISNHGEIRTLRCFFREFLSDQRGVEESMYTLSVSKPDISLTIHQLCHLKRVYVVGFRNSWGRFVL